MKDQILPLTKLFITFPSTADNTSVKKRVIESAKTKLSGLTVEEFDKNGSPSLLAYSAPERPDRFRVILNAHLDVVPGAPSQYEPKEKDGKLYGRGASDMKGAAAVELLVFKELAPKL